MGKVTNVILSRSPCSLQLRYENALSEALKTMARAGRGMAWLPESAARQDLADGRLVPAGGAKWREQLNICLFRLRDFPSSSLVDEVWRAAEALPRKAAYD